jgi:hypothetical protein
LQGDGGGEPSDTGAGGSACYHADKEKAPIYIYIYIYIYLFIINVHMGG